MKKRKGPNAATHVFLILGACIMIFPFVWMALTSLKTTTETTTMDPFVFFPAQPQWNNYITVTEQNNYLQLYINTFAMIALRVVCSVGFSSISAFAFARLKFPGRDILFGLVLFQMMVPVQIFVIPQYLMVDALGARNTIFALLFPGLVSAFGTFLLRQFFMNMPKELEEAARLDGCNIGQIFFRIMLPLAKPGLIALTIFTALFAFKDLMWPLIVNTSPNAATLSSALAKIQGAYTIHYPELMAAAVLAIWPMLAIFMVFQRKFIQGIATTGGKL